VDRQAAPTASHSCETIRRPAHLPTFGTLGVGGQVAFPVVMRGSDIGQGFPGVVSGSFDTVWDCKLLTMLVDEVVANFASTSWNFLHFFPAYIAELAPDGLFLGPAMGNRILYKCGCHPHTGVGNGSQASFMDQEVAHFTKKAIVAEAPNILGAMVTVNGPGEGLLGEGVAMVIMDGLCVDLANNTVPPT